MCDPISIALLTAGGGAQLYGQRRAESAMNRAAVEGAQQQQALQGDINNTVLTGATRDLSTENMASQYQQAGDARTAGLGQMLAEATNTAPGSPSVTGGQQSADYIRARAKASASQMEAAAKLASLMGRAGAQGDMMQGRNLRLMGDASSIQGIGQQMRDAQQQTQYNMQKASHKGDTAQLLGSLAMLAGTMGVGGGAGAATGAGAPAVGLPHSAAAQSLAQSQRMGTMVDTMMRGSKVPFAMLGF